MTTHGFPAINPQYVRQYYVRSTSLLSILQNLKGLGVTVVLFFEYRDRDLLREC